VTPAIDVGALVDRSPWTLYQKSLTALAALAVIFDGFDIQILGFAIPSLMREWHVARAAFAPVLALGLAGMVAGSPIAGYCGDRYGRRPTLIGCIALFGLATVATAFVHSVAALAVLRFVTGMGAGGAVPNAGALVAEFAPARRRPTAVKLTIVCVPLGGMLGGLIAAWVLPAFGWRALYEIGGAMPLGCALILCGGPFPNRRASSRNIRRGGRLSRACWSAWATRSPRAARLRIAWSARLPAALRCARCSAACMPATRPACGLRFSSAWARSTWSSAGFPRC
jgi:AAHS family 4-hydroxybenzoate transporter-like MFS transporter